MYLLSYGKYQKRLSVYRFISMLANSSIVPPRKTPSATPTATTISMPTMTIRNIHILYHTLHRAYVL